MQDWLKQYFLIVFPIFFVAMWIASGYAVALFGGWRLLARHFRAQAPFSGRKWRMQSAQMRWMCNYNNVLTVGANEMGLFLATMFLFRSGHPPLSIPWTEISVTGTSRFLFVRFVDLRLGQSENIPFKVRTDLAAAFSDFATSGSVSKALFDSAATALSISPLQFVNLCACKKVT